MNKTLKKLFQPKTLEHFEREYCYFNDSEIDASNSNNAHKNTCFLLPHLGVIKISGEDALSFLQGQITVDLTSKPLPPMACYLSRKGRIISLFYLARSSNDFYLMMPSDITNIFIKQLRKYVFMSKVRIDIENKLVVSLSNDLNQALSNDWLKNQPHATIENQTLYALDNEQIIKLHDANKAKPFTVMGDWAWHKQRLMNKTLSIYPETIAKFLAHDIELHTTSAIDFKKGCYIGQEIVARMHYKAKLNYHLKIMHLIHDTSLTPGNDLILNGEKLGMIVDLLTGKNQTQLCLLCSRK